MITHSGVWVDADTGVPPLLDIAVQLGRITRWVGSTKNYYSVLHHSFVCYRIGQTLSDDPKAHLACLLHDAHECMTGDVPAPVKPTVLIEVQGKIDSRIAASLGMPGLFIGHAKIVKTADVRALNIEASELLQPMARLFFDLPVASDREILRAVISEYPSHYDYLEESGQAIKDFIQLVGKLNV